MIGLVDVCVCLDGFAVTLILIHAIKASDARIYNFHRGW